MRMICDRCDTTTSAAFAIYSTEQCPTRIEVCGNCLVGEFVPVFRRSSRRWSFGQVLMYRSSQLDCPFLFLFGSSGTDREWLDIHLAPFDAYVVYYRSSLDESSGRDYYSRTQHDGPTHDDTLIPWARAESDEYRLHGYGGPFHSRPYPRIVRSPVTFRSFWTTPYRQTAFGTPEKRFNVERNNQTGSRIWTIDEDRAILHALRHSRQPIGWSNIAELVPYRTGKQCRERYLNHLRPVLNRTQWTIVDDAVLFHLHSSMGPKWMTISSLLRGRNTNSTKSRFHSIRRRLERDAAMIEPRSEQKVSSVNTKLRNRLSRTMSLDDQPEPTMYVVRILIDVVEHKKDLPAAPTGYECDLIDVDDMIMCSRCGLSIPSVQTGGKRCSKSGWCQSCVSAPAYFYGDLLRVAHSEIRKLKEVAGDLDDTILQGECSSAENV